MQFRASLQFEAQIASHPRSITLWCKLKSDKDYSFGHFFWYRKAKFFQQR